MTAAAKRAKYFSSAFTFVIKKHVIGFQVGANPSFDAEGLDWFLSIVPFSKVYLEYGSGGSTIVASRFVQTLVSVESDSSFGRAVEQKISKESLANIFCLYPNIGITAQWGRPIFGRPTPPRVERWKRYPRAPWGGIINMPELPDLILIDGRMRVACALESLLHITPATRILVDDYIGRDYGVIEDFADLVAVRGRMGEFRKKQKFDREACALVLTKFYAVLD